MDEGPRENINDGPDDAVEKFPTARDLAGMEAATGPPIGISSIEDPDVAAEVYRDAMEAGYTEAAAEAAVTQGDLLKERGDFNGAREAWQRAVDLNHPQYSPSAAFDLGGHFREAEMIDDAIAAYRRVLDWPKSPDAGMAIINVGVLLEQVKGDRDGARAAYEQAVDSADLDASLWGTWYLGHMLQDEGDLDGACRKYEVVVRSSHPELAPKVAIELGELLLVRAHAAFQRALGADDKGTADLAADIISKLSTILVEKEVD